MRENLKKARQEAGMTQQEVIRPFIKENWTTILLSVATTILIRILLGG